ncbi:MULTISPECIES: RimK family alpha-L-glutamate ligase [unclassified Paraburkholderia]|uniref:ATP-grasp domain-containing protein n=1 Tax=unclassified Paraburkholderia TaxID=2615204 RepID=UPI002AB2ADA8|nr:MULTISPECIES: RimK family alpha-L-glutamate ligase [unclassified Paraburkholderia]
MGDAQTVQETSYQPLGLSALLRLASNGGDLTQLGAMLIEYSHTHDDPQALLELAWVLELKFERASALAVQKLAISMQRQYRIHQAVSHDPVKLLVFKAAGDLMTNTPFECLVAYAGFQIDVLFVDEALCADCRLPEHDVILVGPCALDGNRAALARIAELLKRTDAPVINRPDRIPCTTRDAAWNLLGAEAGIHMANTVRVERAVLVARINKPEGVNDVAGVHFPMIIRPVGSHAGQGLARVQTMDELAQYLRESDREEFYVASYIDYRSADGLFRKYRIALIDGVPYVSHMGISVHWMVHYPYEEMLAHPQRREEEARFMATFDVDFAHRHRDALATVAKSTGLDYVGLDCAETPDGRLVIFEIATAMVVHDMDDPTAFPYKPARMKRFFDAFCAMVERKAKMNREHDDDTQERV